MFGKVLTSVTIIVALVVASLASFMPLNKMHDVIVLMRFFETMIPVLAVGALLKYITCCNK